MNRGREDVEYTILKLTHRAYRGLLTKMTEEKPQFLKETFMPLGC